MLEYANIAVPKDITSFLWSALVLFVILFFISLKQLKTPFFAFGVVLLKLIVPVSYFLFWSRIYPIQLVDDLNYFTCGQMAYEKIGNDFLAYFERDSLLYLGLINGGKHFGYSILNAYSFILFGENYYSPIIFNIIFSAIGAVYLSKTLSLAGVSKQMTKMFFVFVMLQWDILSWSSFLNLKDIFVFMCVTIAFYNMVKLKVSGFKVVNILGILLACFLLTTIRFYMPYFIILVGIIFAFLVNLHRIKSRFGKVLSYILVFGIIPAMFYISFMAVFRADIKEFGSLTNPAIGLPRYLITPMPWSIDVNYRFLTFATFFHWATMPFSMYGFYILLRKHFYVLLPWLILCVLLGIFYGSFSTLQGPRHRLPLIGFFSLIQFLGLYTVLNQMVRKYKEENQYGEKDYALKVK